MSEERRYHSNPDYILREIGGEAVLVPVGQGLPFENSMITMNETSAFLWKAFSEPRTVGEVIEMAKAEYEDDSDGKEIEECITQYVEESVQLGMLIEN